MEKRLKNVSLVSYSCAHFITDFACTFLVFAFVSGNSATVLRLVVYNFCAFALQMPLGLIADRLNKNAVVASFGCVLVALAFAVSDISMFCVILAGMGNALFHVGAGLDVMNSGAGRYSELGIFVAPGAAGLFFGTMLGKQYPEMIYVPLILLFVSAANMLAISRSKSKSFQSENAELSLKSRSVPALACLFAVVVLRSYAGTLFSFDWKAGTMSLIFVLGVVLGKALSGVFSDCFGHTLISTVSLGLAGILFLFSDNAVCGIAAVLLFNMTMPITLGLAARNLSGAKGFAFGMLTFALFVGCLPEFFGYRPFSGTGSAYCVLCVISLVFLLAGIKLTGGEKID